IPDLKSALPLLPKQQGGAPLLPPSIYSIANVNGVCSAEGILAEVKLFTPAAAPKNWSLCDGQLLPVGSNTALFSLIQLNYGGDGETTFGLPDFSKLSPPGLEYFICTVGVYPARPSASS
ncbi:MAG: phage tail protein, partial [Pyrinomonadaceae bacterium]